MAGRGWRYLAASLFLVLCALQLSLLPAVAAVSQAEVSALQLLSQEWNAANLLGWTGNDVCSWKPYVTCENDAVTSLTVTSNQNIQGTLPGAAIAGLTNLQALEISINPGIVGTLPAELGTLTALTYLNLQLNSFTGNIPTTLGQLKNLKFLALNDNQLNGLIPYQLGALSQVYWFDLSGNLLSGELPMSSSSPNGLGLDTLTSAVHLHLNNNSLSGVIPPALCTSLPVLNHLLLDSNSLGGSIPPEIGHFPQLVILRLQNNNFNNLIPVNISQLSTLTELHLNGNAFTGTLPDVSALQNLQLLDLSDNMFSNQPFPSSIQSLGKLQTLAASNAGLSGRLPSFVFGINSLESLTLSNNSLNGTLNFGTLGSALTVVLLDDNGFDQVAPPVPQRQFQEISLQSNPVCSNGQSSGFPAAWCSPPSEQPYLKSTSCGSKTCLDTKSINPSNCGCFFVLSLIIQLTSPTFTTIDDTRAQQLESLLAIQTSTQAFVVSATFTPNGRLRVQTEFYAADGRDLDFDTATTIVNNFTNQNFNLQQFAPYLVTKPPYPILPPASRASSSSLKVGAIIGIVVAALAVVLIVAAVAFYALRQKKRADKAEEMSKPFASWPGGKDGDSGGAPKLKGARWFSYSDLKKATGNFSESNEIGVGGYGKVYKGKLETGEVVAIKRAQEGSMQGQTEFKNEIELLSRVHHRNLVGLVGFCYEQGEQMLIYEFMPNGTMRDHLMGKSEAPLDWSKRLSIALGSARGLAYLHDLANPPIIHRDIKSSNILLDEKLIAKVADFGLSKLAPDGGGKAHVSTQVKGTLGYLDPEYYMTQQLSDKSDVYSFGVVLLELLTARQPIERGKYIVREVKTALDRGGMPALRGLLDPFLTDYSAHDLKTFLDLALRCVEEAAADRPTMTEVARELEVLVGGNSYPDSGQVSVLETGLSNESVSSYDQESLTRPR